VSALRTEYEFILPRGYLDQDGVLHKRGIMRLATARDELEPLRDPTIASPDDPRLTILVLARVVRRLGTRELVTAQEIEGLFAADLAYLQDFYGVINFGTPADIDALLQAQEELDRETSKPASSSGHPASPSSGQGTGLGQGTGPEQSTGPGGQPPDGSLQAGAPAPLGRRAAIEEVPSSAR
jgi:hypothetical protein